MTKYNNNYCELIFLWRKPCLLLFILLFGFVLVGENAFAKEREVRVGIYNNSPKVFTDEESKVTGIFVDLLEEVAKQENWKITYVPCYWQQCLNYIQEGKIDLMPDVAFSDAREGFLDFNRIPTLHGWTQFFAKESTYIPSPFDLNGKRIALLEGSIQEDFVREWLINFNIKVELVPEKNLDAVFNAVATNKADVGISNNFNGDFNAARYKLIGTPIVYQPVRLFFATAQDQNKVLLESLDKHLEVWLKSPDSFYFSTIKKWRNERAEPFISAKMWRALGLLIGVILLLMILAGILRWQVKTKVKHLLATQEELGKERDAAQQYLDIAGVMLMVLNLDGRINMVNKKGEVILGRSESDLIGVDWFDNFIPKEERQFLRKKFDQLMSGNFNDLSQYENKIITSSGKTLLISWNNALLRDKKGDIVGVISSGEDITKSKQAEDDLHIAATAFETQEGIVIANDSQIILRANQSFIKMTGFNEEEVVGKKLHFNQSDYHLPEFYAFIWDSVDQNGIWHGDIWQTNRNGEVKPYSVNISTVKNRQGVVSHYVCTYVDSSALRKSEDKIKQLAFYDQLTDLPNRSLLLDRLRQLMTSSSRSKRFGALLFIDVDHFKTLNDTLGHDMGDLLLQQIAERLKICVRENDTIGRLGGDEFVVLLASVNEDEREAAAFTELLCGKILDEISKPFLLREISYRSTLSIGATLFRGNECELDVLLKQADLAMYKAKDAGRNSMRFFDPNMEVVVLQRAALEEDLRIALAEHQFFLHYQAQVAGSQITGAEVLVRWQHPQRGIVGPVEFISMAEEMGLIIPLGIWVLETACQQLATWEKHKDLKHLTIAVNVSVHQFSQHDFVNQVLSIIESSGANPKKLKLELTESLLVTNVEDVVEKMYALKAKGVGFSLDDFGTGYSSLSYLKRLPLDQLKIDQSFVRDVLSDPNDAAIAKTIITLAQSLGFGVIAEGVETAEQRDFLTQAGCHAYQGYFFSRPIAIADFNALVLA